MTKGIYVSLGALLANVFRVSRIFAKCTVAMDPQATPLTLNPVDALFTAVLWLSAVADGAKHIIVIGIRAFMTLSRQLALALQIGRRFT